jgi:alkanesulfonate monooxygenase SsuD/methylene tetrahydromethanopterin reductase-like flavin-dependent oxidoreductase (luciferase family)
MAHGLDRAAVAAWCRGIDEGPFSSVSAGERITFRNLEGLTLCAAAAALTERVRVLVNVAVLPWHRPALIAKQLATIDVLSAGRAEVAVGVGGRDDDYRALGVPSVDRHQRLDDAVHEVRRLWAGGPAADGAVVGPAPVQPDGPRVLASAMGPKSLARAAAWADGVSAFSLLGEADDIDRMFRSAEAAWRVKGRHERPRLVVGAFVVLGDDARETLSRFTYQYLEVLSPALAKAVSESIPLHTPERVRELVDTVAELGGDELIFVPGTTDPSCLDLLADVVRG